MDRLGAGLASTIFCGRGASARPSGVASIMARTNPIPRALAVMFLAAVGSAGASCSTLGSVSLHDFLVEDAKLFCSSLVACGDILDGAACQAALGPGDESSAQQLADLDAGKVEFDALAAAECLDFRRRHEKDCDSSSRRADPGNAACERVFVGVVPVGGACFRGTECSEGSCHVSQCECGPSNKDCACCPGTCERAARFGEPCDSARCADGLVCASEPGASTRQCEPPREAGEPCDDNFRCVRSVVCVRSEQGGMGVCAAAPAEGESCPKDGSTRCARDDDWCDPVDSTCKRRLPLDAPCVPSTSAEGPCRSNTVCNGGKCSLPPAEGEPCFDGPGLFTHCRGGLSCMNGVCEVYSDPTPFVFPVCK